MSDEVSEKPTKRSLKERLSEHMAEYGKIALYTYLTLSLTAIIGFSIAIGAGIEPSSASGMFGVIGAGWLAAKATMPIRILVTLGLTPLIATVLRRRKGNPPDDVAETAEPATASASEPES